MRKLTLEERLWMYACCGDIESLAEYYNQEEPDFNVRYYRLGKEHSLIMGAFRNNQFNTVEFLLSVGETVTPEEKAEIEMELKRIELMYKMVKGVK